MFQLGQQSSFFEIERNGLDPGANELLTQGWRVKPARLALRASRPAAITLRGCSYWCSW
ncbi:hypothetical protein D554_0262 [Bordetella holmesii 30539]|nr:hypothetical protein D554_0262 [Bordetella holmesii 30539]